MGEDIAARRVQGKRAHALQHVRGAPFAADIVKGMASTANSSFRAALDSLVPYQPGRPVELVQRELGLTEPCVKLASNEGQYGPFPAALEAIARAAAQGNRYPDGGCYALRTALAEQHGLDPEQIVVGNGADAVLNYLSLAMLEPGDEVAFCWPSFPVYPINAAKMGAVSVRAPLAGSATTSTRSPPASDARTKIVYVTNPNNPTGGMVGRDALARFLDGLPEHVLSGARRGLPRVRRRSGLPRRPARAPARRPPRGGAAHVLEGLRAGRAARRLGRDAPGRCGGARTR